MTAQVRGITDDDARDWFRLGAEAFSPPPRNPGMPRPDTLPSVAGPGVHPFGVFDDGELLARVVA